MRARRVHHALGTRPSYDNVFEEENSYYVPFLNSYDTTTHFQDENDEQVPWMYIFLIAGLIVLCTLLIVVIAIK
jgi:hypothetical protein